MSYIFGPVPSRRLGLSLGVDLIPPKTCTYDCLYCQIGKTTRKILEPAPFVPVEEVIEELKGILEKVSPDVITFSGSGEPTLHSGIGSVIGAVRGMTRTKTALLTNGSLLWREEVRERIIPVDTIMPTLSTAFEETFETVHRPHPGLRFSMIMEGLKALRKEYRGNLFLEVVLLKGLNDSDRDVAALKKMIDQVNPDRIQLNTVVRPPADARALPLDRPRLEAIKSFLGPGAEIIADVAPSRRPQKYESVALAILEMAKRRPVRIGDVAKALDLPEEDVERFLKGLTIKGRLQRETHGEEIFYLAKATEVQYPSGT